MNASHTSIVITVPGLGDDIQANKAGMIEIADIFVVNKADREGADMVDYVLESMLRLTDKHGWKPPVVKTIATGSVGINELADRIDEHFNYLKDNDLIRERQKRRAEMEIVNIARDFITRDMEEIKKNEAYNKLIEKIIENKIDPHSAVEEIMMMMKARYDRKSCCFSDDFKNDGICSGFFF